jgi:hypothetical protein
VVEKCRRGAPPRGASSFRTGFGRLPDPREACGLFQFGEPSLTAPAITSSMSWPEIAASIVGVIEIPGGPGHDWPAAPSTDGVAGVHDRHPLRPLALMRRPVSPSARIPQLQRVSAPFSAHRARSIKIEPRSELGVFDLTAAERTNEPRHCTPRPVNDATATGRSGLPLSSSEGPDGGGASVE